jgi:hypothetical protein
MTTIAAIQKQRDSGGILDIMQATIGLYGFKNFIISGVPGSDIELRSVILLSGWNRD